MDNIVQLEKIQKISMWLRYLVIFISLVVIIAIIYSYMSYGHGIVSFANHELGTLWQNPTSDKFGLSLLTAPIVLFPILNVYWLQKLFGEYQKGEFFTSNNMRCYLWLIWLKVFHFFYSIALPYLFQFLPGGVEKEGFGFVVDISSFFTWLLLICIVYLLKMAQEINNENKEFI